MAKSYFEGFLALYMQRPKSEQQTEKKAIAMPRSLKMGRIDFF